MTRQVSLSSVRSRVLLGLLAFSTLAVVLAYPLSAQVTAKPATEAAPTATADLMKAEAEKTKAVAELRKIEVEMKKAADARMQFFFDWSYRVGLAIAAVALLLWLIPQVSEISVPWGGGTLTAKRAPKEPAPTPAAGPPAQVAQATEVLKKELAPGPETDRIVDRLEETQVYQAAGVGKDTIYVCHRARSVARTDQYRLRIYLDSDDASSLDKVEKVTYRLHPTFPQQEVTKSNQRDQFALDVTAWGEFMLYAFVYFKGIPKPIQLKRYLNF